MMAPQAQTSIKPFTRLVGVPNFLAPNYFGRLQQMRAVFLIAVVSAGAACSNKALYENIQQNQLRACESLPVPQQAQCKSQYDTTYEEYRRGLEQIGETDQASSTEFNLDSVQRELIVSGSD